VFAALGEARVTGATVLDAFAGSGALAIEALSRGAARAVLVDRDPAATDAIRRNLRTTGLGDRARVQRRAVGPFLRDGPPTEAPFDLVFLDPPYEQPGVELGSALTALAAPGWLAVGALVVLERAVAAELPPLPAGWVVTWRREYGDTLVVVATPATARP